MYPYIPSLNVPSHSHDHRALSRVPCAIPWRRAWQPTPGSLRGASHGQGSLAGCSPWCLKESDTTEQLNTPTPVLYSKFSLVAYFKLLQSCLTLCDPLVSSPPDYWDFPGKNTGVDCHALLQGIFLIQGLNPWLLRLLPCRQILYH